MNRQKAASRTLQQSEGKKGGSGRYIICILSLLRAKKGSQNSKQVDKKSILKKIIEINVKFFQQIYILFKNLIPRTLKFFSKLSKLFKRNQHKISDFREALYDLEIRKNSSFQEKFLFWTREHAKHLSILIVATIVLLGNLLVNNPKILTTVEGNPQIDSEIITKPPQETENLMVLIKDISRFTPLVKEDATKISQKITLEVKLATANDNFLLKPHILGIKVAHASSSSSSKWYLVHIVKKGESVGVIGQKFGVSSETILATNNISDADLIKPGQHLKIPNKNGTTHVVARGESVIGIVRYYHGDLAQTVKVNNLKNDRDRTIYSGQRLFIVNGKKPRETHLASSESSSYSSQNSYNRPAYASAGNHFPYGYCTWYVASRRNVPWHGNANQWLWNARGMGYSTGRTPQVGAVMVTNESWYGHVAYVEAVNGNTVTISEMNYVGWGRVNYRTLSAWYGQYIY